MNQRVIYAGETAVYSAAITGDTPTTAAAAEALRGVTSPRRRAEIAATYHVISTIFGDQAAIGHDMGGAPYIEGRAEHISISHCADAVVIAVNPRERIGIDIELWRPKLLNVKEKFLTPGELRRIFSQSELLQAWTVKEAVYKAASVPGLSLTDIHLPVAGSDVATVDSPICRMAFDVHTILSTEERAITLVTP